MAKKCFEVAQREWKNPSRDWSGYCLVFVRTCFGVGAKYASAANAWRYAKRRHPETDPNKIPRGVPVFWTGGSHGYGHVALSRGDGSVWTTDLKRKGKVDTARITDVHARWGLTLVGWTEDLNGVTVYAPPKPKAKPKPKTIAQPKRNRIQWFHVKDKQNDVVQVFRLDNAVKNGRVGTVKTVRDELVKQIARLPQHEKNTRVAHVVNRFHKARIIDLATLRRASRFRPGVVKSVYKAVVRLEAQVPAK